MALEVKLELVLASSHAKDFEAVNFRNEPLTRLDCVIEVLLKKKKIVRANHLSTYFEEYVRETSAEVCTIDVELLLSRKVDVAASRTVNLHSRGRQLLGHSDW